MNKGLERVLEFEGNEVKVRTSEGIELFNLINSSRNCGLIRNNNSIRWDDVKKKLKTISSSIESSTPQYIEEINYILDEIENGDDRNSIYASRWISSRLAMECKNDKAMRYKNWLATLDENYSKGSLQNLDPNQFGMMSQQMQMMAQSMSQIGQAFQNIQTFVADSINSKDLQISDMRDMIGFRDINTKKLSKLLKQHVEEQCGHKVWATSKEYIEAKEKVFEHFDVLTWEQLPITLYQQARTYILTNF